MTRYVVRRVVAAAVLVAVVSSGALLLTLLAPGDFASELFGGATVDSIAAERARYGLDRPVARQFVDWLGRAARLDFAEAQDDYVSLRSGGTSFLKQVLLLSREFLAYRLEFAELLAEF